MKVTRQVVSDLWPIYSAGEASDDTRLLVEEFLAADPDLARTLKARIALPPLELGRRPDAEVLVLRRTRDLVRGGSWLRGLRLLALVLTVLAVMRAINTIEWAAAPTRLIGEAVGAAVCWALYALLLRYYRLRALRADSQRR
jgi:hypothetical protein